MIRSILFLTNWELGNRKMWTDTPCYGLRGFEGCHGNGSPLSFVATRSLHFEFNESRFPSALELCPFA